MKSASRLVLGLSFGLILLLMVCSCRRQAETPKPVAYFRIDLPEHNYRQVDTTLPFVFEQSEAAQLSIRPQQDGSYWVDLDYPALNATFKITYLTVPRADSLRNKIIREEKMVKFHYQKADDVEYSVIQDPDSRLWGQIYDIAGKEVATPLMFWMTDSTHQFLRTTLYFNFAPNNDSLEPVIQYLRDDALHFVNTFKWK
ncbi:MAG: hypothetical protein IKZ52_00820 [Bacteroidales bacterium]|nr:hypothetical protein [Bacteroidales bacterium]